MRKNCETAAATATAATLAADAAFDAAPAEDAAAHSVDAAAVSMESDVAAESGEGMPEELDPAGGITLSGRSRAGMRARVLTGMMVTAGLVACVGGPDTVSSFRLASVL